MAAHRPDTNAPNSDPQSRISGLNAIVDHATAARAGWSLEDLAAAYLDGGARFLQVRAKALSAGAFLAALDAIVHRAAAYDALVVANDRADLARMSGAGGVHVGQDDLPPRLVRQIVGARSVVGLSTHTVDQIERALEEPISYLAIGPVFATGTKATGYDAVGLERVGVAVAAASQKGIPVVAIGGVTLDTATDVIEAGAAAVAVIGDLLNGNDPAARVRAYVERLSAGSSRKDRGAAR